MPLSIIVNLILLSAIGVADLVKYNGKRLYAIAFASFALDAAMTNSLI